MSQGEVPFDAFSMDDVDPDRPGSGGGGQLPEGGYRFLITEVVLQNERGSTEVKCEVTQAKDQGLIGRTHTEFLRWPKPEHSDVGNRIAKEQLLAWCYAAKTTNAEIIKTRQKTGQGFDSMWLEAMLGAPVLGFVKHDTYTDNSGNEKTSSKIEGRVWAIDNPKGKGIPGWVESPTPAAGPGGTAATPQQPAATPPPQEPPPATNAFDGLV